jgi:hypothetical protein
MTPGAGEFSQIVRTETDFSVPNVGLSVTETMAGNFIYNGPLRSVVSRCNVTA